MDERTIKRLLVIVAVSIVAIMLFKTMMSKTIINLNKVAAEKKLAAQQQAITPPSDAAIIIETPAVSTVGEGSTLELPAASSVSEIR